MVGLFFSPFESNFESLQVLEACTAATDCGSGLYCGNCPASGRNQPVCTRGQATIPTSVVCDFEDFLSSSFVVCCDFEVNFDLGFVFVWDLD